MFLIITFSIILVASTLGFIAVGRYTDWDVNSILLHVSGYMMVISGFILLIAVSCAIGANCPGGVNETRKEYIQKVDDLNESRRMILLIEDDKIRSVEAERYNKSVSDFRTDIQYHRRRLGDKWMGWFISNAYRDMDEYAVDYIETESKDDRETEIQGRRCCCVQGMDTGESESQENRRCHCCG